MKLRKIILFENGVKQTKNKEKLNLQNNGISPTKCQN